MGLVHATRGIRGRQRGPHSGDLRRRLPRRLAAGHRLAGTTTGWP